MTFPESIGVVRHQQCGLLLRSIGGMRIKRRMLMPWWVLMAESGKRLSNHPRLGPRSWSASVGRFIVSLRWPTLPGGATSGSPSWWCYLRVRVGSNRASSSRPWPNFGALRGP